MKQRIQGKKVQVQQFLCNRWRNQPLRSFEACRKLEEVKL
jgi:hypothetical protein